MLSRVADTAGFMNMTKKLSEAMNVEAEVG